ncbi:MAG: septum site-determining protein MinC [Wujia sp.]
MFQPVVLKGNKTGIRLIISPDADMKQICDCLQDRLKDCGEYYSCSRPIQVTLEGKNLTEKEKQEILDLFIEKGIKIKKDTKDLPPARQSILPEKNGLFYVGSLRNGQSITAAASIVIVGDVEAGASVESEGNIVVIGKLQGTATSGCNGRQDTFVYSLT